MILSTVLREYFMFGAFPKIENMDRVWAKQDMANKQFWYSHPDPGFLRQQTKNLCKHRKLMSQLVGLKRFLFLWSGSILLNKN